MMLLSPPTTATIIAVVGLGGVVVGAHGVMTPPHTAMSTVDVDESSWLSSSLQRRRLCCCCLGFFLRFLQQLVMAKTVSKNFLVGPTGACEVSVIRAVTIKAIREATPSTITVIATATLATNSQYNDSNINNSQQRPIKLSTIW